MSFRLGDKKWLSTLAIPYPVLIAGPCSAETEEQVHTAAHQLKGSPISFFRAGLWKPRTRPGMFEGVGVIGLKWLQDIKKELGYKIATEVANKEHVRLALTHDVDMLWIGARSTANPFTIQEIADALQGTDKIVLVKNPVNPDLALWIGALERLHKAGIKHLGAIHRGFSSCLKTPYRNPPEWQIAMELQHKFPELPLLCDPSHMTGKREMIYNVAETALNLNYDGLMIEVHPKPKAAWSDAAQQVTPSHFTAIIRKLKMQKNKGNNYQQQLHTLRTHIDEIDMQLIDLLKRRMLLSDNIGMLKKEKSIAALQHPRWNTILNKMIAEGKQNALSEAFITQIYKIIHQESIHRQEQIIKSP